jgi:hypothetical protein
MIFRKSIRSHNIVTSLDLSVAQSFLEIETWPRASADYLKEKENEDASEIKIRTAAGICFSSTGFLAK